MLFYVVRTRDAAGLCPFPSTQPVHRIVISAKNTNGIIGGWLGAAVERHDLEVEVACRAIIVFVIPSPVKSCAFFGHKALQRGMVARSRGESILIYIADHSFESICSMCCKRSHNLRRTPVCSTDRVYSSMRCHTSARPCNLACLNLPIN